MSSLSLDEIDLHILNIFHNQTKSGEDTTVWKITKQLFPNMNRHELSDKCRFIRYRLDKLNHFEIIKSAKNWYALNNTCVKFSKHNFPNGCRKCILLKIQGKWTIWEI